MTFEKYKVILFVLLIVILIYIIYNYQEKFLSAHEESQKTKIPENHEEEGNTVTASSVNEGGIDNETENNSEVLGLPVNDSCLLNKQIITIVLSIRHLRQELYKPEPIWSNETFCVYKVNPIASLDQSIDKSQLTDEDMYYSLGDVILFKDYPNYIKNFSENMKSLCKNNTSEGFENHSGNNNSHNNSNRSNNKNHNQNTKNNSDVLEPDSNISNYDQPGIKGLKYLIKNGRKPLGFSSNPIAKIEKDNGENLYIWEPIAPDGYVFLGHAMTMGVNAVAPKIDTCNIRAIPINCITIIPLEEKNIIISNDLFPPNRIYTVAGGKYIKGAKILNVDDKIDIVSFDISPKCFYFERDINDFVLDTYITFTNYEKDEIFNTLDNSVFDLFKTDFESKIEEILLKDSDFQLNNFINNPDENSEIKPQKRYEINSSSPEENKILVLLKIKHRAVGYNELLSIDLFNKLKKKICEKKFDFARLMNMKTYYFKTTLEDLYGEVNVKDTKSEFDKIKQSTPPTKIYKTPEDLLGEEPVVKELDDGKLECSGDYGPEIQFNDSCFKHPKTNKEYGSCDDMDPSKVGLYSSSSGSANFDEIRSPKITKLKKLVDRIHRGSHKSYDSDYKYETYDANDDKYYELVPAFEVDFSDL